MNAASPAFVTTSATAARSSPTSVMPLVVVASTLVISRRTVSPRITPRTASGPSAVESTRTVVLLVNGCAGGTITISAVGTT